MRFAPPGGVVGTILPCPDGIELCYVPCLKPPRVIRAYDSYTCEIMSSSLANSLGIMIHVYNTATSMNIAPREYLREKHT
jgi:hypothetical protein